MMKSKKILKIAVWIIILTIFGCFISYFIMVWGMGGSDYGYNSTKEENIFTEEFDKKTKLSFIYTNRHHDSIVQNIDIYDRNDSLFKITFLNKQNIKRFSDSTFNEFMKVYNQKDDVDTLKMKFHLSKIDTIFVYKVDYNWFKD